MEMNMATTIFAIINLGILLAIVIGAVCLIVALTRRGKARKCAACGKSIPKEANVCPYCGENCKEEVKCK